MFGPGMKEFIAIIVAASLAGAGCSKPDSVSRLDTIPEGARMTTRAAIDLAKTAARNEGLDPVDYDDPTVSFGSIRAKTWQIYFKGHGSSDGKHFYIYVDDPTEQTRFFQKE
jgi:hypothetical protein